MEYCRDTTETQKGQSCGLRPGCCSCGVGKRKMSSEGDPGGQLSTTTLSTVAVQAGDTQIVVAVLKVPKLLLMFKICNIHGF